MLFEIPHHELSDAEIAAVFRDIIAGAGRFPRHIELCFAAICAEHLVDGLRLAGLIVIRPTPRCGLISVGFQMADFRVKTGMIQRGLQQLG